jgi:putative phage-type endonuclease
MQSSHKISDESQQIVVLSLDGIFDTLFGKYKDDSDVVALRIHADLQAIVRRSVPMSYVTSRLATLKAAHEQLLKLKEQPVVVQRSPEWYAMRDLRITASDLAQAIGKGKFGTQKEFLVKKSGYVKDSFNPTIPPLKWGTMFEPCSNSVYEAVTGANVHEFGLLPHPTRTWFGASPDGVCTHGVMLEIKSPYRRKIDGTVPEQYALQMQGQLEVCGLTECDYIECSFRLYESIKDYEKEPDPSVYNGVILERRTDEGFEYRYSPFGLSADATLDWVESQASEFDFDVIHPWYLVEFMIQRVYRDTDVIEPALDAAETVWQQVLAYRADKSLYDAADLEKKPRKPRASAPAAFGADEAFMGGYAFIE